MDTKSYVGIQHSDGSIEYIYVHTGVEINALGRILNKYYNTYEIVCKLIKGGSCMCINPYPSYDNIIHISSIVVESTFNFFTKGRGEINYYYLYANNIWYVMNDHFTLPFPKKLVDAISIIENDMMCDISDEILTNSIMNLTL
jgi:hypothetical protein